MVDISYGVEFVSRCISAAVGWLQQLLDAIPGSLQLIMAAYAMYMVVQFLLIPFIGSLGAGSDTVDRNPQHRLPAAKKERRGKK